MTFPSFLQLGQHVLGLFPVLCPLLPTWEAGTKQSHKAGHGMSSFQPCGKGFIKPSLWVTHSALQGQGWSRELIPGNAQCHLRTQQACAGDVPGLMEMGQGHQMARPRSGKVMAMLLGGLGWEGGSGTMSLCRWSSPGPSAHALLALPRQAAEIW